MIQQLHFWIWAQKNYKEGFKQIFLHQYSQHWYICIGCIQLGQEEIFVAGASLITLVHLVTWGWCLHPVCGDVVAAGKCEVLKLTIQ